MRWKERDLEISSDGTLRLFQYYRHQGVCARFVLLWDRGLGCCFVLEIIYQTPFLEIAMA